MTRQEQWTCYYGNVWLYSSSMYVIEQLPNSLFRLFDRGSKMSSLHDTLSSAMLEAERGARVSS